MRLIALGERFWQSLPHQLVRGRLRYVALALIAVGAASSFVVLRPATFSATWWLLCLFLLVGLSVASTNWRRVSISYALIYSFLTNLLLAGIAYLNPNHPETSLLFLLSTVFVATLFTGWIVIAHLIYIGVVLLIQWQMGGSMGVLLFTGLSILAISGFLRGLNLALYREASQSRTFQSLMELLPVLKVHGLQEVIAASVRQLVKATGSHSGIVLLLDRQRQILRSHYVFFAKPTPPEEEEALLNVEIPVGTGLVGWVAQHQQSLITGDGARDPRAFHVPNTPIVDESLMVIPLLSNGQLYGVLRLHREGLNQYRSEELAVLELMAAHVSDALSRAELEERMSRTDALTGVYNRHYLNEWSQHLGPGASEISLLMIDCRGFKRINDRFGHLEGDRILKEMAALITQSVRSGDLIVRYGGDEFLVVLRHAGAAEAERVKNRLLQNVALWNEAQPTGAATMNLDIGVDTASQADWSELFRRADERMYASKRTA